MSNSALHFAIIQMGEKQHVAIPGEAFECERIEADIGSEFSIDDVIFVNKGEDVLIKAEAKKYKVVCDIVKQFRDDKIIVFKKKRRKDYSKKRGHRQYRTIVNVKSIEEKKL